MKDQSGLSLLPVLYVVNIDEMHRLMINLRIGETQPGHASSARSVYHQELCHSMFVSCFYICLLIPA